MIKAFLLLILLFLSFNVYAENIKLFICADDIPEFPNILLNEEKIEGVLIDVLKMAVKNLEKKVNIELKIELMPWARCIYMAETGKVDAVMNASYSDERALFMDYPPHSGSEEVEPCSSKFKITCSGYAVITLKSDGFEYTGKLENLPTPVRAARGYSIVSELEKSLKDSLEISKSDLINIKKLIRDREGSAMVFLSFLTYLNQQKNISSKLKINKQIYGMKSYFIPFSKKSIFPDNEKILIWEEIASISNNKKIMNKIHSKYASFLK